MKKFLITLLKFAISMAILVYLVRNAVVAEDVEERNVFQRLLNQPKRWELLVGACGFCASAVMLTLIRWWYLVRALGIPLRFASGLRIGLFGYLFNLVPVGGIIGGDLLKAWMLAWQHRDHRARAVASVAVDRIIGLYVLFVVASAAILLTGFWKLEDERGLIFVTCTATFVLTVVGAVGIGMLLVPGVTDGKGTRALSRLPRVGHAIGSLIEAMRMYRRMPKVLTIAALMSVGVHTLFATGVYLIARGLPGDVLSLGTHYVINPLSASTGAIPLAFGPFELLLEFFYTHVPEPGVVIQEGQGLVVALGYRLICILIAMVGACYYLGSRGEVAQALREAEQEQQAEQASQSTTA